MADQKKYFGQIVAYYNLGHEIYYKRSKNTLNLVRLIKPFLLFSKLYGKTR